MGPRNYILATAGHVDHGKSALVKALTGRDPDRLPEEKARGITIDLGFGHLRLPAGPDVGRDLPIPPPPPNPSALTSGATTRGFARESEDPSLSGGDLNVGIVDVPGHEDFVKNMVAGIGAIDAALLVVAADDGWMPQSEEHLQILEYAGVSRGVVALTKIDRIEPAARLATIAAVHATLAGTALAAAPVVPTSVITGEGLDELKREVAHCLLGAETPRAIGKPRLWIDRAFSLHGVGTVVTGSLRGGALAVGQVVAVGPRGMLARIRTIHHHNAAQSEAQPGTRTALNLVGPSAAGTDSATGVARGDLVTLPDLAEVHDTCDVLLTRSGRSSVLTRSNHPLPHGATVRVHIGTTSARCRVIFADREVMLPGERCVAQLRVETPLPFGDGEHVILRDPSERMTLAGGVILEAGGTRKRFRSAAHRAFLLAHAACPGDCRAWLQAKLQCDGFLSVKALRARCRFGDDELACAGDALRGAGEAVGGTDWVGSKTRWVALKQTAEQLITEHERQHPTQNGLPLAQLRANPAFRLPVEVIDALVADLVAGACEMAGAAIRHRSFRPSLPASLQASAEALAATLRRTGLNPPLRKDLARTAAAVEALEFLIKTGRVVALSSELALAANAYRAATRSVCQHLEAHGRATVSELKQAVGVSRRVMVPLLERMDRDGLTLREGEYRVLRQPGVQLTQPGVVARTVPAEPFSP